MWIYNNYQNIYLREIKHFFNVYKDLEGKQTAVKEFGGPVEAAKIIYQCLDNYNEKYGKKDE